MKNPLLVDSHCHLNYPDFNGEYAQVIDRAHEAGIGVMQTICTKMSEFPDILSIAESTPHVYASVGVHPHEAENDPDITTEQLIKCAKHPKVIGIGETGLDYFYEHSPRDIQQHSFRQHIAAARETGLPLIVHTREADDDTIAIMKEEMTHGTFPALIHCFSSTRHLAEEMLAIGCYISLSGILTFKKATDLQDIAKDLPLDRILVETDAPFLAPVPHRGKRCEPAYTKETAKFLAELKQCSFEQIATTTTHNFFSLFKKATPLAA